MSRERLPAARLGVSVDVAWPPDAWRPTRITVRAGFHPDGRLGEVFIAAPQTGEALAGLLRDGAILASLALQHGAPLATLREALTRDDSGRPASLLGVALEAAAGLAPEPRQAG